MTALRQALKKPAILVLIVSLCVVGLSGLRPSPEAVSFSSGILKIETEKGEQTLEVEYALTPQEWMRGLMHRTSLEGKDGMLFIFPQERPVAMWMKNTPLSLDMVFIAKDGRVIRIARSTTPHSTDLIKSGGNAKGVLELEAGRAEALKINPGDRIIHAAFAP